LSNFAFVTGQKQNLEEDVRRSPVLGHQADDGAAMFAADAVTDRGEAPAVDADLVAVAATHFVAA